MQHPTNYHALKEKILAVNAKSFNETALELFYYQYDNNGLYQQFCKHLKVSKNSIQNIEEIPFLPISFFKSHEVRSTQTPVKKVFQSSGTTGMERSQHFVSDLDLYEKLFTQAFENAYGALDDLIILALLPSYQSQQNSSLIYMVDCLLKHTHSEFSGYYLEDYDTLNNRVEKALTTGKKVIVLGVTYALLNWAEQQPQHFGPQLTIMETGGMKGRRKELLREELHQILCKAFGVESIHSEYGMTELMSQAYSYGNGIFYPSDSMKVLIRDTNDPFCWMEEGKSGGINIIDLGNINSCAFIATQDLGKLHANHGFEILGRFDHSDIRGCNLLVQ